MLRKIFRRMAAAILIVAGIFTANVVHAEIQTYTGVGEYYMSDFETFDVAQQRAKQRAEQNACEMAGVYVENNLEVVNAQVTKDEIITMTSGILKVSDVQYHREHFGNNTTLIRATITAQIDSDDVLKWLNKDSRERSTLEQQYAEIRKAYAEQEQQIAELKRQLAGANTQNDAEQIAQKIADEDKIFLSNQKVDEAWKIYERGDYSGAAKLYDEAIDLNPDNALAYYRRGTAYEISGQYENAILDLNRAIELNPDDDAAYINRGNAYSSLGQYDRAIADYTETIRRNPNSSWSYNNRGNAYSNLGQHEQAIADYTKAIELNPNFTDAYYNRALAYARIGNLSTAIDDAVKALQLNPNYTYARQLLEICYTVGSKE